MDQKHKEEHDKLHSVISELMDEAANKTKQEVDSLKRIYNANLEKLIEECNSLESVIFKNSSSSSSSSSSNSSSSRNSSSGSNSSSSSSYSSSYYNFV